MRTNFVKLVAIVVFSLFLIPAAHAALIEKDDSVFGADSITLDTDTGIEWLDVTLSTGNSRSYVNTQFGADGDFEGFRYATTEEALALWETVSLYSSDIYEVVEYWSGLVGATDYNSGYPEIIAMTGSGASVGAYLSYSNGVLGYNRTGALPTSYGSGFSHSTVGNWLVRTATVPIPGAVWLFGSGLLGLISIRRKNSRAA
ncbi:hypothetical protein DSCO28_70940 [Desulfosarcina ovata subsp. sediminis]|uniref:PEP-CTERM protein-sorting domain-containing protein n=1 Tax=Desulfosarcina ovata subsp. sediminis TaxID=885957 RepID=A0A5K8A2B4_9BACT|nr:hypothetical protein [Desulfosarcina ovata]BBO86528.1 hypothetical protein DSCO28_70940 [Desulfosarcina ovata subsp. sediminis]